MPSIRMLVKNFSYPLATPHVYTGIESILPLMARMSAAAAETPSKRSRRAGIASQAPMTSVPDTRLFALVIAVFMFVLSRMTDEHITPEQYKVRKDKAMRTVLELPAAKDVTYDELSPEIEDVMHMAVNENWLRMEWFLNISAVNSTDDMEGVEMAHNVTSRPTAGGYLDLKGGSSDYIGLGTMLQDATDYLGERQRQDYKNWKAGILARVEEIETGA